MSADTPTFSRSGTTALDGKLERRLDTLVSEETEGAVIAMAALHGIPKSEMVRQIVERALFGEFSMMQRVARDHLYSNPRNKG